MTNPVQLTVNEAMEVNEALNVNVPTGYCMNCWCQRQEVTLLSETQITMEDRLVSDVYSQRMNQNVKSKEVDDGRIS